MKYLVDLALKKMLTKRRLCSEEFTEWFGNLLFSHSVPSNSLHGLQHIKLSCQTYDANQPSHSLLPPSRSALNLSQHQSLFQWVGSSHQVAKVLALQLQHQSLNEYSELISLSIDWFDLLAVQGTLKSFLQHHSLKASILRGSRLLMVQLSYLYMTTGKTTILTIQTFVGKMMPLLFNMLSRLVIALYIYFFTYSFTLWFITKY